MIDLPELAGVVTALITPFKEQEIDERAFISLIEKQLAAKVSGIVTSGTTGESASLSLSEKLRLIDIAKQVTKDQIITIANIGTNCTKSTIDAAILAQNAKADVLMIVTPYYNRPNMSGIYQHYEAINKAVVTPILVYSVYKRCGIDLDDELILRLSELSNIIGIKDANEDLSRVARIKARVQRKFYQFSGDDINCLAYNAFGGIGCVSVAANIIPDRCVKIQNLWQYGNVKQAIDEQNLLLPLYQALACESNPIAIKYAASLLNLCLAEFRLPMCLPSEVNKILIQQQLAEFKMI